MQCSIGQYSAVLGSIAVQYWVRCSIVEAPEMVMQAKDLSKMMAKYKYRPWYLKIDAIISKHGYG